MVAAFKKWRCGNLGRFKNARLVHFCAHHCEWRIDNGRPQHIPFSESFFTPIFMSITKKMPSPHITHLSKDKKLLPILQTVTPYLLKKRKNVCVRLCASIMSQQLSTKVADVIFKRFLLLYDGNEPTPQEIVDTSFEQLRGIGLSNAKVSYVQNVARYLMEHSANDKKINKMSDEEVIAFLTPIKGVGRWTVEMLLMFTLGREDVFAVDDLGIQQAMSRVYKIDQAIKRR